MPFFNIIKTSKKSKARTGVLHTPHGDILTPAFVPVATRGTLKTIPPKDLKGIGTQVAFVNTFHLTLHPGVDVVKQFGGIHKYAKLPIPLMSDSAGFQVFSLGGKKKIKTREGDEGLLLSINEEGVRFRSPRDGKELMFTPEISMWNQEKIGADILMAFDECIPSGVDYEYTKQATQRTHNWLLRCIKEKGSPSTNSGRRRQFLYGIVQGGVFKDLREESAKFVSTQEIDGVAIGGVSVGETKKEMKEQVGWVAPYLPKELPCHLLGIGRIEDIQKFVKLGIDTFDCVEPTRLARNGVVFQKQKDLVLRIDLLKTKYLKDKHSIQSSCACYTCKNFSLSFLHHLYKEKELLGYYLATYHNLFFFEQFFKELRQNIAQGKL
ncbi:MAG: tRNA guanosine(34) transglycosylase Tgt [Candidatus Wildermuthbacteria bacterium]|nr:tRNA guanosine(34) transglycosylase Tgt [Candidatus Wildermuthbacteria bacterium]